MSVDSKMDLVLTKTWRNTEPGVLDDLITSGQF